MREIGNSLGILEKRQIRKGVAMSKTTTFWRCMGLLALFFASVARSGGQAERKAEPMADSLCRIEAINYRGWQAQQVSNSWVKLIFVPQNGGRLMQVIFDGHPFLFVNPEYAGKYLPPSEHEWFNYGGDKLWVLPEGNEDEKHWVGNSDQLDDGPFAFQVLSQGQRCEVSLTGPADPRTGLQFTRTVSLGADAPRIGFHTVITNASGHTIEWSVQSVSQYDTADARDPLRHNQSIWGFTSANPTSSYLNRYHVKFGPAENSAAKIRDNGLFALHYVPMAAELWVDSKDGWLAVVDGASQYAMVERFRYDQTAPYPGKASVIFWTNGPQVRQNPDGTPNFGPPDKESSPFYMEAELNSPLLRLYPGESHSFDTEWFPTRADTRFEGVTDSGVVLRPLYAAVDAGTGKINISGAFGVFFSGKLVAHFYDAHGAKLGSESLMDVDPTKLSSLKTAAAFPGQASRVSVHLVDASGLDRGALGEVQVAGSAGTH
jgi:hypothetical protein